MAIAYSRQAGITIQDPPDLAALFAPEQDGMLGANQSDLLLNQGIFEGMVRGHAKAIAVT